MEIGKLSDQNLIIPGYKLAPLLPKPDAAIKDAVDLTGAKCCPAKIAKYAVAGLAGAALGGGLASLAPVIGGVAGAPVGGVAGMMLGGVICRGITDIFPKMFKNPREFISGGMVLGGFAGVLGGTMAGFAFAPFGIVSGALTGAAIGLFAAGPKE